NALKVDTASTTAAEPAWMTRRVSRAEALAGRISGKSIGSAVSSFRVRMAGRILVAEDDDGVRLLVGTVLHRAGFRVDFAGDGTETIASLTGGVDYDAIVLDLMMPGSSGFEVLAWMHREKRDASRRRVIV